MSQIQQMQTNTEKIQVKYSQIQSNTANTSQIQMFASEGVERAVKSPWSRVTDSPQQIFARKCFDFDFEFDFDYLPC